MVEHVKFAKGIGSQVEVISTTRHEQQSQDWGGGGSVKPYKTS